MSDPIVDILDNKYGGHGILKMRNEQIAKLIRQQIGREINKVAVRRGHFLAVREVCQLEEE